MDVPSPPNNGSLTIVAVSVCARPAADLVGAVEVDDPVRKVGQRVDEPLEPATAACAVGLDGLAQDRQAQVGLRRPPAEHRPRRQRRDRHLDGLGELIRVVQHRADDRI